MTFQVCWRLCPEFRTGKKAAVGVFPAPLLSGKAARRSELGVHRVFAADY